MENCKNQFSLLHTIFIFLIKFSKLNQPNAFSKFTFSFENFHEKVEKNFRNKHNLYFSNHFSKHGFNLMCNRLYRIEYISPKTGFNQIWFCQKKMVWNNYLFSQNGPCLLDCTTRLPLGHAWYIHINLYVCTLCIKGIGYKHKC